jgi:hypothetical protein
VTSDTRKSAAQRTGGRRRAVRFVAGVLGVLLLAVVVDVGWALYRNDQRTRQIERQGLAEVLANADNFAHRLRAGLAQGPVDLVALRTNVIRGLGSSRTSTVAGIGGLSSSRTGTVAVVSYESYVHVAGTSMFGSIVTRCFSDRIDLAAVPPAVVHREINCRELTNVNRVPTLVPVAPR